MAFKNHISAQLQRVKITTCDPKTRRVEAQLKDGAVIQVAVWEIPSGFRWPVEGEFWTVHQRNHFWHLGQPMEIGEGKKPVEDLEPGDSKIGGPFGKVYVEGELRNVDGNQYVGLDHNELVDGEVPTWENGKWVAGTPTGGGGAPSGPAGGVLSGTYPDPGFAVDMATQAELSAGLALKQDAATAATDAELNAHKTSSDHDGRYYTETEVNTFLAGKSDTGHTHDSRYYTETEIDTALALKQDAATAATDAELNAHKTSADHDGRYYTETEVDTALALKQDASTAATDAELTAHKTSADHDSRYYTETEVDTLLGSKQDASTAATDAELSAHTGDVAIDGGPHGFPALTADGQGWVRQGGVLVAQTIGSGSPTPQTKAFTFYMG